MGNRAVITTCERKVGVYLHWNGGRDTVEPLLKYCELQGYRPPSSDDYGWARLCQVMGNFFGGSTSLGVGAYTADKRMNPGDSGIYAIDGWRIVDRVYPYLRFEEQREYDFGDMLRSFDEVWLYGVEGTWVAYPVVGFGQPPFNRISVWVDIPDGKVGVTYPNLPYVARYDHHGDFSWNSNNYVRGDAVRIKPRGPSLLIPSTPGLGAPYNRRTRACPPPVRSSRLLRAGRRTEEVNMKELKERATEAVSRFLDRRGYIVLETNWKSEAGTADIVAEDGCRLVFVKVSARDGAASGLPVERHGAAEREKVTLAWLAKHDVTDVPIRFDEVAMAVISPDRAMIRHRISSMSSDLLEDALSEVV